MQRLYALSFALGLAACGGGAAVGHLRGGALGGLSDAVLSLAVGPRGGVWIGTDNGLVRFARGSKLTQWKGWQVTAATPAGPSTAYVGVAFLKGVVHTKAQMREARVYKVYEKNDEIKVVQQGEAMMGDTVDALLVDRRGNLWLGTRDRGVLLLEKGADDFKPAVPLSALGGRPTGFAEGPDGTLYIGSFGGGVHFFKDGKVTASYDPKNSDMRGNGVVRSVAYHPTMGLFVATANKLPGATVGDIEAQSQGTGCSQFHQGKWKSWTAGEGLKSNNVSKVAVAPDGSIWFLTLNAGVSVYRGGPWWHPPVASEMALAIGFHGREAWVATNAGMSHISGF
jgi:ligand-binding sensor domain-containing protein